MIIFQGISFNSDSGSYTSYTSFAIFTPFFNLGMQKKLFPAHRSSGKELLKIFMFELFSVCLFVVLFDLVVGAVNLQV